MIVRWPGGESSVISGPTVLGRDAFTAARTMDGLGLERPYGVEHRRRVGKRMELAPLRVRDEDDDEIEARRHRRADRDRLV